MRKLALAVIVAGSVALLPAQTWSITAHAPVVGTATASVHQSATSVSTQTAQLPVGPVAAGQFLASQVSFLNSTSQAMAEWQPSVAGSLAPLAFTARVASCFQGAVAVYGGGNLTATLDLALTVPNQAIGRLLVQFTATSPLDPLYAPLNSIKLDVGANGSIEVMASPTGSPGSATLPMVIPATGALIRLQFATFLPPSLVGSLGNDVHLTAQFVLDPVQVAPFDTTGAGSVLTISQFQPTSVTLHVGNPGETPLLLAFGAAPLQMPVLPTITLLVTLDALYPIGVMTLPLPPLPPGTAIYAQGLVLDAGGVPRSTNSIRALWQ
jgi:hypothetical protein